MKIKKSKNTLHFLPFYLFIVVLGLFSCDSKPSQEKQEYTTLTSSFKDTSGPINVVTVVSDTAIYQALEPFLFEPDVLGKQLPGSLIPQSFFGFRNFTSNQFQNSTTTRIILYIKKGKPQFVKQPSKYAKHQAYMEVYGENLGEIKQQILQHKNEILQEAERANFSFLQERMQNDHAQELERLGIYMKIPEQYNLIQEKPNYQWYRLDKIETLNARNEVTGGKVGTQTIENFNIQIEKEPLTKDSLTKSDIAAIVNAYGLNRLQGNEDHVMEIQKDFLYVEPAISSKTYEIYDFDGMWEMQKELYGGSFIGRIILNKTEDQMYFVLVSINAPNPDHKRDNIIHALSMVKSFKILKKDT